MARHSRSGSSSRSTGKKPPLGSFKNRLVNDIAGLVVNPEPRVADRMTASILDAMTDDLLFGRWFRPWQTWGRWRVFLAALFGLPMDDEGFAVYREHTGRTTANMLFWVGGVGHPVYHDSKEICA